MKHKDLIFTIQNCESTCEEMSTYLKKKHLIDERTRQARLIRDCADICGLTAKYISRKSYFSKNIAGLCAYICEICAHECMKYPDPMSQSCAQICMHCAKECKAYSMM